MFGFARKVGLSRVPGAALAALLFWAAWISVAAGADRGPAGHGHEAREPSGQGEGGKGAKGHGERMGDLVYAGPVGPWSAEVRLVDMKAEMAKVKASPKVMAKMTHTHHVMVYLAGPGGKSEGVKPLRGTVTVTGPDKRRSRADLVAMGDHIGADLTLPQPGTHEVRLEVQAGDRIGSAYFSFPLKGP